MHFESFSLCGSDNISAVNCRGEIFIYISSYKRHILRRDRVLAMSLPCNVKCNKEGCTNMLHVAMPLHKDNNLL
jgi:hypothetical protein